MTQNYLDSEIALAKKIFMYYTDKMYDYLSVGSDKYQIWYRDSLQLYFLLSLLESVLLYDNVAYIGATELSTLHLRLVFDKVREYYTTECEIIGEYGDIERNTIVPKYYEPYMADWKEVVFVIQSNNTTSFQLPFTWQNIDPESLIVTVDDSDPIPCSEDKEGYHILNNVFYWHHYFNLNRGKRVHFKYKQIKGI